MIRGILYYLFVWIIISAMVYGYSHLSKRGKVTLIRSVMYGLVTATIALGFILLLVYLF
jgi:hypothetical protein